MADRKAFEAWLGDASARDDFVTHSDGEYLCPSTQADWEVWQAAIKHERERCAQVCLYPPKMEFASGYLATEIRSRPDPPRL